MGRPDRALRLSRSSNAMAPFSIGRNRMVNFNSFPFCLAFTVTIADNEARRLMNIAIGTTNIGTLSVGNRAIFFALGGTIASFYPFSGRFTNDVDEVIHFQICVNSDGEPTLYVDCKAVSTAEVNFPHLDTSKALIVFLNSGLNRTASSLFYTVRDDYMMVRYCGDGFVLSI